MKIFSKQLMLIGPGYFKRLGAGAAILLFVFYGGGVFAAPDSDSASAGIASVDDFVITTEDFDFEYREEARRRFYHSKPADDQLQVFKTEIRDSLIDGVLLAKEAKRLGLAPSQSELEKELLRLQEDVKVRTGSLQGNELYWNLVQLRLQRQRSEELLREWLYGQVRISEQDVQSYYNRNLDKFTEPERYRLSVILLNVDPSSATAAWQKAEQDAKALVFRLHNGEAFAELAHTYSDDVTAANGGDMGYQHQGMLAPDVSQALAEMSLNAVAQPIRVLEGFAIFKLTGKIPAKQRLYNDVRERAEQLLLQEARELAWQSLLEELRNKAVIVINIPL